METSTETTDIDALRAEHASLEHLIAEEVTRPCPDQTNIGQWKRRKLKIKDQLVGLAKTS